MPQIVLSIYFYSFMLIYRYFRQKRADLSGLLGITWNKKPMFYYEAMLLRTIKKRAPRTAKHVFINKL